MAGVAHVEQDVAADGYDLQDGVDDDYDDKISVMNSCTIIVDMIWWSDSHQMVLLIIMNYCY